MVGTGKYSDAQIRFIVTAKKQGWTNSEIVNAFRQRWLFHDFSIGSVKYVVHKYQDDPNYNGGLALGANGPQLMIRPFQAPGSAQIMMQARQAQAAPQMMMRPQHPQSSALPVIQPQHPQGSPQAIWSPHIQGLPQTALHLDQAQGSVNPTMHFQQTPSANMTTGDILALAHSVMSPIQFFAFSQALALPQVPAPAITPQIFQAPTTGVSPQLSQGCSTPGMATQQFTNSPPVGSPQRSQSSSPGMSHLSHGSSPVMSPQSPHCQSTPTKQQVHPTVNNALSLGSQQSRSSLHTVGSPQLFPSHAHAVVGQQSQASSLSNTGHGQFQGLPPDPIDPHHALAPAVTQPVMTSQGIQLAPSALISDAASHPAIRRKEPTPYRGIVPPLRPHSQKGQLGMIRHFFDHRDPLSPNASSENRVSKKSPKKSHKKSTIRLQRPMSPLSPPELVTNELGAATSPKASLQNERALHAKLVAALAGDPMDVVTPEITAEVDALFGSTSVVENASVASTEDDVLFIEEKMIGTAAEFDLPTKKAPAKPEGHKREVDPFFQDIVDDYMCERDDSQFQITTPGDTIIDALLGNKFPDYKECNGSKSEFIPPKSNEMSKKGELAQTAAKEITVAEEPDVEEMTIEEQYLYGIRQGLPNKDLPVRPKDGAAKEPATNRPTAREPFTNESTPNEPVADEFTPNEPGAIGVNTKESLNREISTNESIANKAAPTGYAPHHLHFPPGYISDEELKDLQMHYVGPYPGSEQAFEEMYLRPYYASL
ncbi:hypothetical protein OIDMADRAFT_57550 [Oidiodendron maius Zn]|uniref:Uncharacterized protein n=1 Tax=Oidiodendron maius (strain Zn) TaxID=913774 RepID=A0A0C3CGD6_OIDMZ|nr:hypothetical protein OIDMADRAFT_57550 [Oidiodendron maius Zn]